jgi:hypothetical protein
MLIFCAAAGSARGIPILTVTAVSRMMRVMRRSRDFDCLDFMGHLVS